MVRRVFSRSAALTCAPEAAALIVFRTRPHRSGCQLASKGRLYRVDIVEAAVDPVPLELVGCREFVMLGLAATVGNSWARASFTCARAAIKAAAAEATFWLEMLTFSSSAFNSGLFNISHHLPLM